MVELFAASFHRVLISLRSYVQHTRYHPPQEWRKRKPDQRLQYPDSIFKPNQGKGKHRTPFVNYQNIEIEDIANSDTKTLIVTFLEGINLLFLFWSAGGIKIHMLATREFLGQVD